MSEEMNEKKPQEEENEISVEEAAAVNEKRAEFKQKAVKEIREWVVALVSALIVVLVIRTFLFTIIRVDGMSMSPTLDNGERLFVTVADVKFGEPSRNDVVICHYPNRGNTYFVKRVVGVPGDVVCRKMGVTYVNGEALDPRGILYEMLYDYDDYTLGENEYFCVGDNRYDSHDSRDWNDSDPSRDVGPVTKDMIVGKVRQVIWPLNSIRPVEAEKPDLDLE